eukprot:scaffold17205_cov186-Amphora_coffeaeformis.AAC.12
MKNGRERQRWEKIWKCAVASSLTMVRMRNPNKGVWKKMEEEKKRRVVFLRRERACSLAAA